MKKRINIAAIVDKMQTAVQHLASLCPRNRFFTLLLAVANSSLFTLHSSLFISCSSDDASEAPTSQHEMSIAVTAAAVPYQEVESQGATRSWTAPSGYLSYDDMYYDYAELANSVIDVFLTHDAAVGDATTTENPLHAQLKYNPSATSTNKWKLQLPNTITDDDPIKPGNYYAYGFIPRDAADDASISLLRPNDQACTWEEGAILTIQGLKAVANDPCVIIGAKEGFSEDYDGSFIDGEGGTNNTYDDGIDTRTNLLTRGDFKLNLKTGKTTVNETEVYDPNYLYFLFDHLYSALSISMRVQKDYHALRHIKLKELRLKTENSEGKVGKTNVTITLHKTDDGSNPIIGDISYTPAGEDTSDGTIYRNSAGFPLTTDNSTFLGHFMPEGISTIVLTSIYDVYDTNYTDDEHPGNLIRKDCTATNRMSLSQIFSEVSETRRGYKYQLYLTINPTYLYMLSEPDLDNPTVVVN